MNKTRLIGYTLAIAILALLVSPVMAKNLYTPAQKPFSLIVSKDVTIPYPGRDRGLSMRVSWPSEGRHLPVLIWSHGLLGSQDAYRPLIDALVPYGYVVIQPTHADSLTYQKVSLKSFKNKNERPKEISHIIDHLPDIARQGPGLSTVAQLDNIAAGGHSYGAYTTQLLAGMTLKRPFNFSNEKRTDFHDPRLRAFVAMSPQGTGRTIDNKSYQTMTDPILFVTGSKDENPVNKKDVHWRLEAVTFTPSKDSYLLYLEGAGHNLGGISGKKFPGSEEDNANFLAAVQSTTLAFLDAHLKGSAPAKQYLESDILSKISNYQAQIIRKH